MNDAMEALPYLSRCTLSRSSTMMSSSSALSGVGSSFADLRTLISVLL